MIAPLSVAALAVPLLAPLPSSAAEGLQKTSIAADARWVVHFDVQGFLASGLGREITGMIERGEIDADLDEVRQELGIDPLQDLRAVTVYGRGEPDEKDAVVLVTASPAADAVLEHLQQSDDYHRVDAEGLTLHVFEDEAYAYVRDTGGGRLFVVSGDPQRVAGAVRVLDGQERNLLQSSTPALTGTPRPGSFLFVEFADLAALDDIDFDSYTMENAHGLVVEAGQSAGHLFVDASVDTGDLTQAQNLAQVIQGAKALVSLAGGDDVPPAARELIQSIQVQAMGTRISVHLDAPVASLVELMRQSIAEEIDEPSDDAAPDQVEYREVVEIGTRREVRREGQDG